MSAVQEGVSFAPRISGHAAWAFFAAMSALGCASYENVALGNAWTIADGRSSGALVLSATSGAGLGSERSATFAEARARVLASERRQTLAGLFGVSHLGWRRAGVDFLSFGLDFGPGVERTDQKMFFVPAGEARAFTGFILHESRRPSAPLLGLPEAQDFANPARYYDRSRTLLTLEVSGGVDVRFTRAPAGTVALLLGIAFTEESHLVQPAPYDPFRRNRAP